jgi:hypothetical protein
MAALGEEAEGGLEVPEEPEAGDRKKDFHRAGGPAGRRVQATALSPTEKARKNVLKAHTPRPLP